VRSAFTALAIAAALLLPTTALATSAMPGTPPQAQANLPDIEDQVMCPVCGTALNLSFSPQADRERAFIRHEIAQGKTEGEIIDDLVVQYGTSVLAEPPKSGFEEVDRELFELLATHAATALYCTSLHARLRAQEVAR
jgi:cytochrome c-type biogenesis protein CcmH